MLKVFDIKYKKDPANLADEKILEDKVWVSVEKGVRIEDGHKSITFAFKAKKGITTCYIVAIYDEQGTCIYDNPANPKPSARWR